MPVAQVLPDKGTITFWKVTIVHLFWVMIQLVPVTARIPLVTAFRIEERATYRCSALE